MLAFGLGMCEGVDEDSRHDIGHVDIQVGSCIFLSVFGCHDMCTLMGSNPCRRIITTGHCSPYRGIIISGTGSVQEDGAH